MLKEQTGSSETTVQPNHSAPAREKHTVCMVIPALLRLLFSVLVFALLAAPAMKADGLSISGYDLLNEMEGSWSNCVIALMVFSGVGFVVAGIMTYYALAKKDMSSEYVYAIVPLYFAEIVITSVLYGISMPLAGEAIIILAVFALVFAVASATCTIIDREVFRRNGRYSVCRYLPFNLMILSLFMVFLFIGTSVLSLDGDGMSGYQFLLFQELLEGDLKALKACIIALIVFAAIGMLLIVIQGFFYAGETTVGQNIVSNCVVTNLLYLVEAVIAMVMVIKLHSMEASYGVLPIVMLILPLVLMVVTVVCAVFTSKKNVKTFALTPEMKNVESYSFSKCDRLEEVVIPCSVKVIESYAFWSCPLLTSVRYDGTKQEWEEVLKKENWCANTGKVTVYCLDGEIEN